MSLKSFFMSMAGAGTRNLFGFLFWSAFEQPDSTPVDNPMDVYSGQTMAATQTASNLSAFGNNLVKSGASGSFTNYLVGPGQPRAIGLCIGFKVYYTNTGRFILGWKTGSGRYMYIQSSSNLLSINDVFSLYTLNIPTVANQIYHVFVVARTTGAYFILNINDNFYLIGISSIETGSNLEEYIDLSSNTVYLDWCRVKQLASISGDWTLAQYSNTDIANATAFTHGVDAWIVFRLQTKASSGNSEIRFRILDANNYLKLTIDSSNNGRLYETVAGVDTQLGSTATMAQATEYKILLRNNEIRVFGVDTTALKINGTSSNFLTRTDGTLVSQGTGGNITYFYTLDYQISQSSLIAELQAIAAVPEPAGAITPQTLYVSPSGSGSGTLASPMSLTAAIAASGPGTTIIMRAGTYTYDFSALNIFGTVDYPIRFKPYTNESVILQSSTHFKVNGNDVIFDGKDGRLEILSIGWNPALDRFISGEAFAMDIFGARSKMIDCIIHDYSNIGFWSTNVDGVFEGCLTYNIGYGNGSQGHSFYTQNNTGIKTVRDNIWARTFDTLYDVHQYGSGVSSVKGYRYYQNILIKSNWLIGSAASKVEDTEAYDCFVIEGSFNVGLLGASDPLHEVYYERIRADKGRLYIKKANNSTVKNSKFVNAPSAHVVEVNNDTGLTIENNEYVIYGTTPAGVGTLPYYFAFENTNGYLTLAAWRAAKGYDLLSTLTSYPDGVPPDEVIVLPHEYDTTRASIIVYNYSGAASASIDLSTVAGLVIGQTYRMLNAQNPAEYHEFVYTGSNEVVAMTGWTIAVPFGTGGGLMPVQVSTFPTYGIFYLMKAI